MKKLISVCLMVGVLLIPTSAFAKDGPMMGAGEWDAKYDNPWFWLYKDYQKSFDNCVNTTSGGGGFKSQIIHYLGIHGLYGFGSLMELVLTNFMKRVHVLLMTFFLFQ